MGFGVTELAVVIVGLLVAGGIAVIVMRLVRRIVSGCLTVALGVLVLLIGLVVIGVFLANRLEVTGIRELVDLLALY